MFLTEAGGYWTGTTTRSVTCSDAIVWVNGLVKIMPLNVEATLAPGDSVSVRVEFHLERR